MEKFSICITYYNQQDFVKQSLDSVLAIDFPCDYEILCGDDGSTDGTLDIIKDYAQKYPDNIKYFVMDRNETSKSINRASLNRLNLAQKATGNYIMFLDGDDFYCDKSFVKDALDIFNNYENVEVCAFNFKYLYSNNKEEIPPQSMSEGIIKPQKYISQRMYTPSGACVFKNVLNKLDSEINNFDDNAITLYMLQFGDLYYIDKPIYVYRQTNDSLWNFANNTEQNLLNALDYKLICNSAPMFTKEIAKRQYPSVKYLYKNKKDLKIKLGKNYEKYLNPAQNDIFVKNLLCWNTLTIKEKIKTKLLWIEYKLKLL